MTLSESPLRHEPQLLVEMSSSLIEFHTGQTQGVHISPREDPIQSPVDRLTTVAAVPIRRSDGDAHDAQAVVVPVPRAVLVVDVEDADWFWLGHLHGSGSVTALLLVFTFRRKADQDSEHGLSYVSENLVAALLGLWSEDVGVAEGEPNWVGLDLFVEPCLGLVCVVYGGVDQPLGAEGLVEGGSHAANRRHNSMLEGRMVCPSLAP